MMMTWLFLKLQGTPSIVLKVSIDASADEVKEGVNADVTAVKRAEGGIGQFEGEENNSIHHKAFIDARNEAYPLWERWRSKVIDVTSVRRKEMELKCAQFS